MKKISLFIFIAFFLASIVSTPPQGFVHAQEPVCTDAAGGVVPCPPTEEIPCGEAGGPACPPAPSEEDNNNNGGGNQNPPPTPVTVIATLLPITNSIEENDRETWAREGWTGKCSKHNTSSIPNCVANHLAACKSDHGTASQSTSDDGTVSVTCKDVQLPPLTIDATPLPLSSVATSTPRPEEGYLGQCTKADGDFSECKEKFTCEDGLLVMKVDLYSGNGTVYDFYCYPQKPNLSIAAVPGNNATENWTGDCNSYNSHGNLSACLDEYAAACAEEGGDYSEWYDDDGSAGVYCQNESEASQSVPVETALPAAIPADSGPTPPSGGLPWLWLTIGGVIGALLLPAVQKAREAAARTHSSPPPTREHILLNKDNNGTKTGFIKSDDADGEEDPKAEIKVVFDLKSNSQPDEPSTAQYKLKDVMVSSIKSNEQDPKQEDPESNN